MTANIILEVARSLYIFSEPPKRNENWLYLQHIDDAFSIDERWENLSNNERQIWLEKANQYMNELKNYFPDVYNSIMTDTICVSSKPMWWKNDFCI